MTYEKTEKLALIIVILEAMPLPQKSRAIMEQCIRELEGLLPTRDGRKFLEKLRKERA